MTLPSDRRHEEFAAGLPACLAVREIDQVVNPWDVCLVEQESVLRSRFGMLLLMGFGTKGCIAEIQGICLQEGGNPGVFIVRRLSIRVGPK